MKIGMILDAEFPPDPRVENEALSLIEAGFEVVLFCLTYKHTGDDLYKDIQVRRYASNKWIYKLSALAYTIPWYTNLMSKKISHFISTQNIDVLHVHDIRIAGAVYKSNQNFSLPVVLDLHDNLPEVMKFYPHLQKFPGKYLISPKRWKQKEAEFIRQATKVIAVSPEFIDDLKLRFQKFQDKFILVPNTIRSAFYKEFNVVTSIRERYKDSFVLLYVGDTNIRRGLETPIKALPRLSERIPNIKLVIVGKNTTDYVLKDLVKQLHVEQYVDFEGWQHVSLFPSYILASDLCISPLLRNKQHDMAYANKLFQYMSFAKPVLVSNAKAQKRLVEKYETGLVHQENNPEDFADKVIQLFKNMSLRNALGNNGEKFVKKEFNWEQTSKELINLYQNISD